MTDPTAQADRRGKPRHRYVAPLRMTVLSEEIRGESEDLSAGGLRFTTDQPLRVKIELQAEGGVVERQGRILRAESLSGTSTGYVVELDRE